MNVPEVFSGSDQQAGGLSQGGGEFSPTIVDVLASIANDLRRIADHFDPPPPDIVDTPYLARKTWGHDDQDRPDGP